MNLTNCTRTFQYFQYFASCFTTGRDLSPKDHCSSCEEMKKSFLFSSSIDYDQNISFHVSTFFNKEFDLFLMKIEKFSIEPSWNDLDMSRIK